MEQLEEQMTYRMMTEKDMEKAILLYIEYYNVQEGGEWTEQTTYKRIHQVLSREDSYCLVLENNGQMIAFVLGYYEQYDDGFAYDLIEIVVAAKYQGLGIGTKLMTELEKRVKEAGAMLIQLQAVHDAFHEYFYKKLGYKNASNLILKTKIL